MKRADPNKSVLEFLHDYCAPQNNLDYAVMLKGNWGAGKTFLVREFLRQREKKGLAKNLYVSLYGLTSVRQIDHEFYRQLHPILSSRGMKIAAAIGKGIIKAAVKVDLDGDGKEDITLSPTIPDVDLTEFFKTPRECLLIFDDLERCSIPVPDVLGYINSFVEHEGFKAIIVANEDEILRREAARAERSSAIEGGHDKSGEFVRYSLIKEKLIGQTLRVRSTIEAALPKFFTLIRHRKTKAFLKDRFEDIRLLHSQSETHNLRLLKQALWDFERLSRCFTDDHWANFEAVDIMFRIVMSLSFEARSGRLSETQLTQIPHDARIALFGKRQESPPTRIEELQGRYPEVEFEQSLLPSDVLRSLFFEGWGDIESIRKALDTSPYYAGPGTLPPWKVAWHWWDLSDGDFEEAIATVEKQFFEREFVITEEIFQVFGLRIRFSKIGAIVRTLDEVVSEGRAYINDLQTRGTFPDPLQKLEAMSSSGLGIQEQDTDEFKTIRNHFEFVKAAVLRDSLPAKGRDLVSAMKEDAKKFFRLLCPNDVTVSPFYDIPVLASIGPKAFVDDVLTLSPSAQSTVFSALKSRYKTGMLNKELSEEKPWLGVVMGEFTKKLSSLPPLSKFRIAQRVAEFEHFWKVA